MSRNRLVCGVDLGVTGAVVFLTPAGDFAHKFPMPMLRRHPSGHEQIDVVGLQNQLMNPGIALDLTPESVAVAAYEKVGVFGLHARKSVFSFGRGTGRTEAVFELLGYAIEVVPPQTWKATVLRGTKKDKAAAVAYARFRWPAAGVGDDHDLADALCLAEHVRRQRFGGSDR